MTKHEAYERIGEILAVHLDVRDMTLGDGASVLAKTITLEEDLQDLARCLRVVGSGALARKLGALRREPRRVALTKLLPPCPTCGSPLRLCASVDTACAHCDQCDWCGDPFPEGTIAERDGTQVRDVRSGAVLAECPDATTAEHIKNALNGDTDE